MKPIKLKYASDKYVTSDIELQDWARENIGGFINTFDRTIPVSPCWSIKDGQSAIFNLDPKYKNNGTHWVACRRAIDGPVIYYFDSFGRHPFAELTAYAKKNNLGLIASDVKYQKISEDNCGQYCLAFLHKMYLGAKNGRELETFKKIARIHPQSLVG